MVKSSGQAMLEDKWRGVYPCRVYEKGRVYQRKREIERAMEKNTKTNTRRAKSSSQGIKLSKRGGTHIQRHKPVNDTWQSIRANESFPRTWLRRDGPGPLFVPPLFPHGIHEAVGHPEILQPAGEHEFPWMKWKQENYWKLVYYVIVFVRYPNHHTLEHVLNNVDVHLFCGFCSQQDPVLYTISTTCITYCAA